MNDKIWTFLKRVGQKLRTVASRNKLSTVLAIAVIFLIVRPKHLPRFAQNDPLPENTDGARKNPGVATNQVIDPILTLEAGQEGADPKWSLPANLSTAEVQEFVAQIKKTDELYKKLDAAEKHYLHQLGTLVSGPTVDLMFPRLNQGGFKDQKLAADWYAIVKNQNGFQGLFEISGEMTAEKMIEVPMTMRLYPMQTRAIGGQPLTGDILFLKAFQGYLNYHLPYYEKMNASYDNVIERMKKEFPNDLDKLK